MLNLGCGQYLQNPFFQDFGVKSWGVGCVFLRIIHGCIRYLDQGCIFLRIIHGCIQYLDQTGWMVRLI